MNKPPPPDAAWTRAVSILWGMSDREKQNIKLFIWKCRIKTQESVSLSIQRIQQTHSAPRYLSCPYPLNSDPVVLWNECQVWSHRVQIMLVQIIIWCTACLRSVCGNWNGEWECSGEGGRGPKFPSCKLNRDIRRWCTAPNIPAILHSWSFTGRFGDISRWQILWTCGNEAIFLHF